MGTVPCDDPGPYFITPPPHQRRKTLKLARYGRGVGCSHVWIGVTGFRCLPDSGQPEGFVDSRLRPQGSTNASIQAVALSNQDTRPVIENYKATITKSPLGPVAPHRLRCRKQYGETPQEQRSGEEIMGGGQGTRNIQKLEHSREEIPIEGNCSARLFRRQRRGHIQLRNDSGILRARFESIPDRGPPVPLPGPLTPLAGWRQGPS
ncbi:MAG: hypothetical protein M1840_007004 [Geoglossum simile]|nr:MAG: hypothetical protein M1840_007004 [Geoglossum simile]